MDRGLQAGHGTLFAEALTFALSDRMRRNDAAMIVANLAVQAQGTGTALLALAARDFPDTNWHQRLTGPALMGTAPDDARAFAQAALARQTASVG